MINTISPFFRFVGRFRRNLQYLLFVSFLFYSGCGEKPAPGGGVGTESAKTTIQNKGSDTLVNVAQAWAEEYQKIDSSVNVEVSGGGSGTGINALMQGMVDLANSSREMKPGEVERVKAVTGKEPKIFIVGYDSIAVYVHKGNPMNEISLGQLEQIFADGGNISKWSQLEVKLPGVAEDTIVRVSRQSSSGTYELFRERVLNNRDFRLGSRELNGSKEVVDLVGKTRTAMGYSGMGFATHDVKMLKISAKDGGTPYGPSVENTLNRTYPLARSLQFFTIGEPQGALKNYIDWILSDPGQKILEESGYVPISPNINKK